MPRRREFCRQREPLRSSARLLIGRGKVTATKSGSKIVASVVTFTAFYQDVPALSIWWLSPSPFPSGVPACSTSPMYLPPSAQFHSVTADFGPNHGFPVPCGATQDNRQHEIQDKCYLHYFVYRDLFDLDLRSANRACQEAGKWNRGGHQPENRRQYGEYVEKCIRNGGWYGASSIYQTPVACRFRPDPGQRHSRFFLVVPEKRNPRRFMAAMSTGKAT